MKQTLEEQHLEAIDYRNIRNFDRDAFQSFNADEVESCADACAKLTRSFACRFAEWLNANGYRTGVYGWECDGDIEVTYSLEALLQNFEEHERSLTP